MYPLFSAAKLEVPHSCPFNKERDMYGVQEEHKYMETMSKWQCDFCGKAFVSEYYLDQHFANRHSEYIKRVCKSYTDSSLITLSKLLYI